MSKQSMGKTLLRNVIRHTDAHNKIQEEMDMWKMRDWEIQTSHHNHLSEGQMHCDRTVMPQQTRHMREVSEHDDREARICTRRLYEFEANDPDRWGHSGFKELYPEEFESDSEKSTSTKNHKRKKSKSAKEANSSRHSKKASQKKKKKKKKKDDDVKRKKEKSSSSEDSIDDSCAAKDKQRRKSTKSRRKTKKRTKAKGGDDDNSSSGDGDRKRQARMKRKLDSIDRDSGLKLKKKKRKNWKLAGEESSGDSSAN
uniref:NKAP domain containing 1 n=1 Tax=Cynoglossus semilaevis TaxID=244447 RepID=A0A3P8WHD6_CYNSE